MNFTLLGWNFRSTPLEIRDRLSLTEQEQLELVQQINARCGIQESVQLSTCNRTELYLYNIKRPVEELLELLQVGPYQTLFWSRSLFLPELEEFLLYY